MPPVGAVFHLVFQGTGQTRPQYVQGHACLGRDPRQGSQRLPLGVVLTVTPLRLHRHYVGGPQPCLDLPSPKPASCNRKPLIPYVRHVDETIIGLDSRAMMTVIALEGIAFETADPLRYRCVCTVILIRSIVTSPTRDWRYGHISSADATTTTRTGTYENAFSDSLNRKYRDRMVDEDLFRNDLYPTLIWHPARDTCSARSHRC